MALQVWLPLNGNLNNLGVSNLKFSVYQSTTTVNSAGKIGSCYGNNSYTSGGIVSDSTINLGNYVSMFCWVKMTSFYSSSNLTGILGQHRYSACEGLGITMRYASATTGYLSINTGNGSGRTYNTYYGSTLLNAGTWYHVGFTYNNGAITFYVNGKPDGTATYANKNIEDYIQLFCWSFNSSSITNEIHGNYKLDGFLNDVRIYDHCLSEREVYEIAKGLVVHYPLNDPFVEETINLATYSTNYSNKTYGYEYSAAGWGGDAGTVTFYEFGGYANGPYKVYHKTATGTGGIFYKTSNDIIIEAGKTYTFSCYVKSSRDYTDSNYSFNINRGSDNYYITLDTNVHFTTEWTRISRTFTASSSEAGQYGEMSIIYDDNVTDYYCYLSCFQIEEKDHATPYTNGSRGFKYDNTVYVEPDGSKWVRIVHHNNPASYLFSSSNDFANGVYIDENRWFNVYSVVKRLNSYEFMVKQTSTSSSSEVKYRWIQYTSPLTATYANVAPSVVTRITTSGYTDGGYGGLYILNSNTHMVIANTSNGNWYGAFGCWTAWNGGIPGYPNTGVTSGYMDLYVRIDSIYYPKVIDRSGNGNHGAITGGLTINNSSAKYDKSTYFDGSSYSYCVSPTAEAKTLSLWAYIGSSIPTYNVLFADYKSKLALGFYASGTELITRCSGESSTVGATTTVKLNSWNHFVVVKEPTNQLYVNGYPVTMSGGNNWTHSTDTLMVGMRSSGTGFVGYISDIRLYATALSVDDVKDLYSTSAYIDNKNSMTSYQLFEQKNNIVFNEEFGIISKQWLDGLSSYIQAHCQCTLTDDGYRIYRTPNKTYSGDGSVMWGGFVLMNTNNIFDPNATYDNRFGFIKGHRYMLQFEVKGQTTNSVTDIYWVNCVGWGGGGLVPSPSNVEIYNPVTSNYNSSEWKTFTYKWTINDDVHKPCTTSYYNYTQGNTYMSYSGFKYGFGYYDTGELGTDLYIRNIRMYDITNGEYSQIYQSGIVEMNSFIEEEGTARIMSDGTSVMKQNIEI